ncbi:hypothetical protein [Vibrio phage vB_VruC_PG21]|uniref:Lipoprotein n=1 Tax=Vibrio phage vB_VruC_PG21 TaxID=2928757 RepID=A0AAE9GMY6_9VIRU|nr:hypothetical protein [Vibrio sp. CK2-1]MCF7355068.1 hypothetical protein [Vibrio sp. CK2-1]UOL48294.1 hypothetical protein [Vibrio phage vB_VruC_PG21]
MKKLMLSVLTVGVLAGCGGGGGGDSSSSDNTENTTTYQQDGIYLNDTDLAVMVVDSEEAQHGVIVGDYTANAIYIVDSLSSQENTINTTGLTYVDTGTGIYDPTIETTITFNESGADINGTVNGATLMYSFDRTEDSEALDQITGTHTNPDDGQEWTINADGSFVIHAAPSIGCIISGTMVLVKDYYYRADNIKAENCIDSSLDGTNYTGIVATVTQNGSSYLVGAMSNGSSALWSATPY